MTVCAIVQPSYIPWRGYFDLIRRSDVFVFYDDVQFDKHGWRNRNQIKTADGLRWLTIPVRKKGNVVEGTPICEVEIASETKWARKHLRTIEQAYAKAPHLGECLALLEDHLRRPNRLLVDLTIPLTMDLASALGLSTTFLRSSEMELPQGRMERLLGVLDQVDATRYLSGPSAADYMDEGRMEAQAVQLEYVSYNYPAYPQLHPPYEAAVSIIDTFMMLGAAIPWD